MNINLPSDKRTINRIKALAYYQIFGGIFGIGIVLWLILSTGTVTGGILFIFILASGLYCFSLHCGRVLLKNYKQGFNLSLLNQALQTIYFAIGSYSYKYAAGIFCMIGFDLANSSNFLFHLTLSQFRFDINLETGKIAIGFNLFAFFVLYYIGKLKDDIEASEKMFLFSNETITNAENKIKT